MKKVAILIIVVSSVVLGAACGAFGQPGTPTPTATEPPPTYTPTPSPEDAYLEGNQLFQGSEFTAAVEAYQRAIEIDPGFGPAYVGLSRVEYMREVDFQKALEYAQQALEYTPDDPQAYAVLSRIQLRLYRIDDALDSAREAVDLDENDPGAYAALGEALLEDNQFEDAREAVEKAYEMDPQSALVSAALGRYYQETGDFPRAREAYRKAVDLEPGFLKWQILLGDFYFVRAQFSDAEQIYQSAAELAPDHLNPLISLAYLEIARKNFAEAETYIQKVEDLLDEHPYLMILKGHYDIARDEPGDALEDFNVVLETLPEDYQAIMGTGYSYLHQEECAQAEDVFVDLGSAYPALEEPMKGRGYAKLCEGDQDKALKYFRDAVELDPHDYESYMGMGMSYLAQERYEDAADAYLNALKFSPSRAMVHTEFGSWLAAQDFPVKAEKEYRMAIEKNPYSLKPFLSLGSFLLNAGEADRALLEAQNALDLDEENLDATLLMGMILYHQGKSEDAQDFLESVVDKDPENSRGHHYLGLVYRNQNKTKKAQDEIETFKKLEEDQLSEEDAFFADQLIDALEMGYEMTEEKAVEFMEAFFGQIYTRIPEIEFVEVEDKGRTLQITKHATQEEIESGEVLDDLYLINQVAALVLPRIEPEVSNGLIVEFKFFGYTMFKGFTTQEDIQSFSDLIIGYSEFKNRIRLEFEDYSNQITTIFTIKANVEKIRELRPKAQVTQETLSREELREMFESGVDEESELVMKQEEVFLKMMGVVPEDFNYQDVWTDTYSDQVAGFYIPGENTLYLVEQDRPTASDEITLAHEYVHALQDHEFDLEELNEEVENSDQSMALDALLEGDATYTTMEYLIDHISELDLAEAMAQIESVETSSAEDVPYYFTEAMMFPYDFGSQFVAALYERGGWTEVNEAYSDPPQSTEQIIHPEKYWQGELPMDVAFPELVSEFEDSWEIVTEDVLGELGVQLMLVESLGPAGAMQAAEGWGGDEYRLYENSADETYAALIQIAWDEPEEADEFLDLFRVSMENRPGYEVVIEDMVGDQNVYSWQSEAYVTMAIHLEEYTTIVIAPDMETARLITQSVLDS